MSKSLKRYWFEFDIENVFAFPPGIGLGCGVTAINYDDAIQIMDKKIFYNIKMPPIKKYIEDIDINQLDQYHVIPNMNIPTERGIWFPLT
ncbi:MAG: hypothetical protein J0H29_25235 [Sphingobacteriales bacterium]|nr:hypothetical protein [Sphingobacteriales bacterium]